MKLAYISIEGWIISPDVNGCFDCSEEVLVFLEIMFFWVLGMYSACAASQRCTLLVLCPKKY